MENNEYIENKEGSIKNEIIRYFTFWPYFIISLIVFVILSFIYLRYVDYNYLISSKIEIIDKAQDSEMALPTAMTVFNRSMINLENEIGVLTSYKLHQRVVSKLDFNILYFTEGNFKTTQNHPSSWFDDYELKLKINNENVINTTKYMIEFDKNSMTISYDDDNENLQSFLFPSHDTNSLENDLPFELVINDKIDNQLNKILQFNSFSKTVTKYKNDVTVSETGKISDQLNINLMHVNPKLAEDYLNTLMSEFDKDGVTDRQLEYERTIEFVDTRSVFLSAELQQIELRKQKFKEENNLSSITVDAEKNANQQFIYDGELFNARSQKDLALLLVDLFTQEELKLLPVDIGIQNQSLNQLIVSFNTILKERDAFLVSAGPNNSFIKSLEDQLNGLKLNLNNSVNNYISSLEKQIANLQTKEKEFQSIFSSIPEKEKILRTIERELEIKEALFLLLLQKREEAAINYAVIKPSIKIIDAAMSSKTPVSPQPIRILFFATVLGLLLPFITIYIYFFFDNKIHTRDQLALLVNNIPIIGEIPHIKNLNAQEFLLDYDKQNRSPIFESVRMLIANLNFILFGENKKNYSLLVTSSVKGEGKTVISVSTAKLLKEKFNKVILIGADLRNPQIHKYLGIEKNKKGLSDAIFNHSSNWRDFIINDAKFDILLSGTIPPNPVELLSSEKFKDILKQIKSEYDCVVIDSAPCLLVSDTFEIADHVDSTIYVFRSNHTNKDVISFINETNDLEKLNKLSIVLNSVGNSRSYGYQYGYQYGYKYGYNYGYNYGYGYGYSEDKE